MCCTASLSESLQSVDSGSELTDEACTYSYQLNSIIVSKNVAYAMTVMF